jgi:hypothetical protein
LNKLLKIVAVACIAIILATSALILFQPQRIISEKDFPLEVDLSKTVYSVGEKISFSPTIMNRSGKDVNVSSNGEMPCVFFHEVNDTITHGETTERVDQILKANEKMSRVFEFEAAEPGTYILYVHYRIEVNNIAIQDKIDDIIIEVR